MKKIVRLFTTALAVIIILPQASDALQTTGNDTHTVQQQLTVNGESSPQKTDIGSHDAAAEIADESAVDDSPMIALTFDDGPSSVNTVRILDTLEKHGARATFFVIGRNVAANPEVIERAVAAGCEIGNHTYDHKNLTRLSRSGIKKQLDGTDEIILSTVEITPRFMRVPGCNYNRTVKETVTTPIVLWSIDTRDWSYGCKKCGNTAANRKRIINEALKAKDGDIVLMHDIYATTADCCESIVPKLIKGGYKLVTVSELFSAKGVEPENGHIYYKAA